MNLLVTGGAGFIGSHLIDALLAGNHRVVCIDDLSLGTEENILHHKNNARFQFIKLDILEKAELETIFKKNKFDSVFHMAANSDIQMGTRFVNIDLEKTFLTTFTVLEAMKNNHVKEIIFASTSAIYGELNKLLHEETGPLFPVSFYGAAKLSSEAYISGFCGSYNIKAWIFRFPNVIGERATHGVMYDFIKKLQKNPRKLLILGDGKQTKPYLYVKDLVDGMLFCWKKSSEKINYFNLGVASATSVDEVAKIIVKEMGLRDVHFEYTGGDRGWIGDVPKFQYDLSKVHKLGWKAKRSSDEAVRLAVKEELKKRT